MRRAQENDSALEQALCRLYQSEEPPAGFETGWRAAVRREESIMAKRVYRRFPWRTVAPVCAALVLAAGSLWAGTLQPGMDASQTKRDTTSMRRSGGGSNASLSKMDAAAGYDLYTSAESADYGVSGSSAPAALDGAEGAGMAAAAETGRKLVRTASLTIRTAAFESDVEKVKALLESMGGYVEDLYQYGDAQSGDNRTVSLSVRVPSDALDAFLGGVEGVGRVTDRSESTADLTVQYADNEARLNTLNAKMTRLNQLMAQAQDVGDLIELEAAIADTQYQIDSYETSQRGIDRRVDMSAVSITLMEESPAQSAVAADVSLGRRLSAAFSASVKWLGGFLRDLLVFVTMILPVVIPAAIVLIIGLAVRRRKKARGRADETEGE